MTELKLVPVEPTREMIEAGISERQKNRANINPYDAYKAMLAAAPQQAAEPVAWMYLVNGVHVNFSSFDPPDDAYDAGTLVPLYAGNPPAQPVCATCNGHGMIGGPSYREPDEGGVPCPDCTPAPVPTSERLPTEADAGETGLIWWWSSLYSRFDLYSWNNQAARRTSKYWQPTGLTRPAAPGGE